MKLASDQADGLDREIMPKKKMHRSALQKLQRAWDKADAAERAEFKRRIGMGGEPAVTGEDLPTVAGPLASGRYLTPDTIRRIEAVLRARGETFGGLKQLLGLEPDDLTLARALHKGAPLRLQIIARLQSWLSGRD